MQPQSSRPSKFVTSVPTHGVIALQGGGRGWLRLSAMLNHSKYACFLVLSNNRLRLFGLLGVASLAISFDIVSSRAHAQAMRSPIRSYNGSHGCPCPYDQVILSSGSIYDCGKVSSWSRSGGASPTCYQQDMPFRIMNGLDVLDWNETLLNCMTDYPRCVLAR